MDKNEYLSSRVDDQIDWFDKKSRDSQIRFKLLRGIEIFAAATIPVVAGFAKEPFPVNLTIGLLGALIVIVSAILSLNQYQENWTEYRKTSELIKHHKFLFLTSAPPYENKDSFSRFAQQIENILTKENQNWAKYTQSSIEQTALKKEDQ